MSEPAVFIVTDGQKPRFIRLSVHSLID